MWGIIAPLFYEPDGFRRHAGIAGSPKVLRVGLRFRYRFVALAQVLFACASLSMVTSPAWAQLSPQAEMAAGQQPVRMEVHRLHLERLAGDHAELTAEATVVPGMDAELKDLRLTGVHLNATPVYVHPIEGRFLLHAGVPLPLPPVQLVVYYTDLPSPTALDDMLAAQHVHVQADVRAQLQVSLASKLLMGDLHPVAAFSLDAETPFDRAAVDPDVQAGVTLLGLAQRALGVSASLAEQLTGMRVDLQLNPVDAAERRSLLLVRTTFHTRQDAREQVCERLGFWLDAHHVMVPAEALQPWAYTLQATATRAGRQDEVDQSSVETVLLPFVLTDNEAVPRAEPLQVSFRVEQGGTPQESRVLTPDRRQVSLRQRNSAGNYAILRVDHPPNTENSGAPLARLEVSFDSTPASLRLFRYRPRPVPSLRALPLDAEDEREQAACCVHQLPRPVDATYFGSPVVTDGAVVGMVTGETTWISLPPAARARVDAQPVGPAAQPRGAGKGSNADGQSAGAGAGSGMAQ